MNHLQATLTNHQTTCLGPPLLILLVGTGIYFTFGLGLLQFRHLPTALKMVPSKDKSGTGDVMQLRRFVYSAFRNDWYR